MLARPASSSLPRVMLMLTCVVALAGCGTDGKDVGDVRSCLEDAGFTVIGLTGHDKKRMQDAALGSYQSKDGKQVAFATAGLAKTDKDVKEFEDVTGGGMDALLESLGEKVTFKTGTDGRYVWAYGGTTSAKQVKAGKDCVKP